MLPKDVEADSVPQEVAEKAIREQNPGHGKHGTGTGAALGKT